MSDERESLVINTESGLVLRNAQSPQGLRVLQSMLRRGELAPVIRGVYARPEDRPPHEQFALRARAVGLRFPDAVLAGPAAASVLGLGHLLPPGLVVDVVAPGSRSCRRGTAIRRRDYRLHGDTQWVDGIQVTTSARAAVESALFYGPSSGLVTAESALWRGRCRRQDLVRVLAGCASRSGVAQAREVCALASDRSQTPGESLVRWVCARNGLPQPLQQVKVFDSRGCGIGVVDFMWPDRGLVVEFDGLVKTSGKYGSPMAVARKQLNRESQLVNAGLRVFRGTWKQLSDPEWVRQLVVAFSQREGRGGEFVGRYRLDELSAFRR
ncbi:endonuclease domain-containing protein [Corynebacterium sp. TAE3-ERU12]|uniref:endonuclease domain-containing protein n=1 Tax=Corynebacterium sp. TAE3-ERU12 TaxID=2849491 RepID=UPI001C477633|nr:endonuclease domain-containing protein [Corynebacterium sp. TAE3-ERU12]MBV7294387.1 endonuclease domain-containing protein [Corynebacterium sp. TAE3-ERU12]